MYKSPAAFGSFAHYLHAIGVRHLYPEGKLPQLHDPQVSTFFLGEWLIYLL